MCLSGLSGSSIAAKPQRISFTQKGRLKYAFGSDAPSPVITATTNSEFSTASCIAASLLQYGGALVALGEC